MRAIVDFVKREPAVLIALLGALFAMFAAFGLTLTTEQTGTITAVVVILLGIVTRQAVTPNAKVAAKEEADAPKGDLVAGPASDLPDDSAVDVIPAEYGMGRATPPAGVPAGIDPANVVIVTDKPLPPDDGPQGYGSGV